MEEKQTEPVHSGVVHSKNRNDNFVDHDEEVNYDSDSQMEGEVGMKPSLDEDENQIAVDVLTGLKEDGEELDSDQQTPDSGVKEKRKYISESKTQESSQIS